MTFIINQSCPQDKKASKSYTFYDEEIQCTWVVLPLSITCNQHQTKDIKPKTINHIDQGKTLS